MAKKKNPGGRPTRYREIYADQAYKLTMLGYVDRELADFFQVEEKTINNWKKAHPKFLQSLNAGKDLADAEVVVSLYQRAKGYKHKETKVFNNNGEILTYDVEKHYPPETGAIALFLHNRQPKRYRNRQEIESTVKVVDDPKDIETKKRMAQHFLEENSDKVIDVEAKVVEKKGK